MAKRKRKTTGRKRTIKKGGKKKYIVLIISVIIFLVNYFSDEINKRYGGEVSGEEYTLIKVSDGDTITVRGKDGEKKIRFYGVDAPESSQSYGTESKKFLTDNISGKKLKIKKISVDRYSREVSIVYAENVNINEFMLKEGYAWWYRDYAKDEAVYEALEREARNSKKGLWKQKNPLPPWEYRKNKNKKNI